MENLILVDASYTSFYRFFATLRWFSFSNKDEYKKYKDDPKYDWSQNKIFIEKYKKMYLESIIKLIGKRVYKKSKLVFCLDSPQKSLWRNKLIDDYKGERQDLTLKNNYKPTFKITYDELIPNLVKENPEKIYSAKVDKVEADDIIALLVRYYRDLNFEGKFYLVSGDEDFLQLGDDDLYFVNYKKKKVFQLTKDEAEDKLLQKIICGDPSDNIKCIFPKDRKLVSNKLRKEVKASKKKLQDYLKTNPDSLKRFNTNRQLIDFNMIPEKYVKRINKKIKSIKIYNE